MSLKITVKIIGPGGCFDQELAMIYDMFKSNGYTVTIEDGQSVPVTPEKVPALLERPRKSWPIVVEAEHCPWGG